MASQPQSVDYGHDIWVDSILCRPRPMAIQEQKWWPRHEPPDEKRRMFTYNHRPGTLLKILFLTFSFDSHDDIISSQNR